MSSKTPKYIRERREKTKKIKESEIRKPAKRWLAGFSVGWKLFEGLFASLGALVPVLSLYPRFLVNAQALSDLSDPFSAPFVIHERWPFAAIRYRVCNPCEETD